MSEIRMTRIDCDEITWRRFKAQAIELGQTPAERLGAIIRAAVVSREKHRAKWARE
jgi:hypothetical protein